MGDKDGLQFLWNFKVRLRIENVTCSAVGGVIGRKGARWPQEGLPQVTVSGASNYGVTGNEKTSRCGDLLNQWLLTVKKSTKSWPWALNSGQQKHNDIRRKREPRRRNRFEEEDGFNFECRAYLEWRELLDIHVDRKKRRRWEQEIEQAGEWMWVVWGYQLKQPGRTMGTAVREVKRGLESSGAWVPHPKLTHF